MDGAVSGKPPGSKDGVRSDAKNAYVIMIIVVDKL